VVQDWAQAVQAVRDLVWAALARAVRDQALAEQARVARDLAAPERAQVVGVRDLGALERARADQADMRTSDRDP
jgi:hypothetical protein